MAAAACELIRTSYPSLDEEIISYVGSVLEDAHLSGPEELFEAVGELIMDSVPESTEGDTLELCTRLFRMMTGEDTTTGAVLSPVDTSARLLNAPVSIQDKIKYEESQAAAVKSIWMAQPEDRASLDQKKLQKVESKIKQKQEKRAVKQQFQSSQSIRVFEMASPSVNQAVSRNASKNAEPDTPGRINDIRMDNFDISFGDKVLLQNAELSIVCGRRYGLVGRNGLGKSTFLRAIAQRQLILPPQLSILHVEQEVDGDETPALESVLECDEERATLLRREKQLLAGSDESSTDLTQVYARLQEIDADNAPSRASVILCGLGFSKEMQQQATKELSGGWRMRVSLARALFFKPDLLLLDEPTNMLDMKAIIWLETYLQSWPGTILVVSHDRCFLDSVATDVIHLHSQRLDTYRGNYSTFVKSRDDKLKSQQREYEAQQMHRQHMQDFVDRWRYNAKRSSMAQSRLKAMEKLPDLKPVIVEPEVTLRFPETEKLKPPIIQLDNVSFEYSDGPVVYNGIDLSITSDTRIALLGDNGSGKTTLLKLLMGELEPTGGFRHAHRKLKIGYFAQHHVDQLVMDVTALELLQSKFPGQSAEVYRGHLGSYGITGELALRPVASLSGGQKSRLAFSLVTASRPNMLVLDEPTNHLDLETVEALGKALLVFQGGVVIASHDENLINHACNEIWLCKDGRVQKMEKGMEEYKAMIEALMNT